MGRYVIRADPEQDLYLVFSTVVDNFILIGSRDEASHEVSEEALAAADTCGTSSVYGRGAYDGKTAVSILAPEPRGERWYLLARRHFADYARLILDGREAEAEQFLELDPAWSS